MTLRTVLTGNTFEQQRQIINLIGSDLDALSASVFSGSYNDLTNKPTIPGAYSLPTASNTVLGGIKIGSGLSVDASGFISATRATGEGGITDIIADTTPQLGGNLDTNAFDITGGTSSTIELQGQSSKLRFHFDTFAGLPAASSWHGMFAHAHDTGAAYYAHSSSWVQLAKLSDIPAAQVNSDWTATTGLAQILNKPTLFSGSYTDLTSKPTLFSGSYTDLTNKPTIPAAQIQSDWSAVSGLAQILNKPTLFSGSYTDLTNKPTLFSGSYTDLTSKPTIPAAQIQSDWTQSSIASLDYIKNKPTLFSGSYTDLTNKPTIPSAYTLPTSSPSVLGGVKIDGSTITITASGIISATPGGYTLPTATSSVLGGVKVASGSGLSVDASGFISATGGTGGGGISDIIADTTPQLGGNLDTNAFDITGGTSSTIELQGQSSKLRFHFDTLAGLPSATDWHGMFAHAHDTGAAYYAHSSSWVQLAKLSDIPAAQVNSDWNASSGLAQILNKPTIPAAYSLPTASNTVLGGIKIGSGLTIDGSGVVTVSGITLSSNYTQNATGATGAVARTIQSKLNDQVNVKDFGAVGDGSNDDTTAIQNAINSVQNANGGTVCFPAGIYKITNTLLISKSNTKLLGVGSDFPNNLNGISCTIRWHGSSGGTMISMITPPGPSGHKINCCGITGLQLIGNGGGNNSAAGIGLYMKSIFKCHFEHMHVKNVKNTCYFVTTWYRNDTPNRPSDYLTEFPDSQHNIFNQCDFDCIQHSDFYSCHGFRLTSDPMIDKPSNTLEADVVPKGNTSVNEFHLCDGIMQGNSTSGYAFWLEDADNNSFYTCRVYRVAPNAGTTPWANTKPSVYINGRSSDANHFWNYSDGCPAVNQTNTYEGQSIYIATGPYGNANRNSFLAHDTSNGTAIPYCQPGTDSTGFKNTARVITDTGQLYNYTAPLNFGCGNITTATSPLHVGNEATIEGVGDTPRLKFKNNSDSSNNKIWQWTVLNQEMYLQPINDSGGGGGNLWKFTRNAEQTASFIGTNSGITWFNANNTNQTLSLTNAVITTSDSREKIEINNSILGIDFIKSLRPVSYKFKTKERKPILEKDENGNVILDDNGNSTYVRDENNEIMYETFPGLRNHYGFIAQEVKQSIDNAGVDFAGWVIEDLQNPESKQGLRYEELIAPLTKALQEALIKIETLEQKVSALENIS